MTRFIKYIGILLLTVIMASCGSSGGGGGGGGDSSINSGTSSLTVAIGNVSASGVVAYSPDIPAGVESVMITVMIQGSIQTRIVNIGGKSGITETFTGPNGTWDVRVIAYNQVNAQGPPSYLGQTIQGVNGDATIYVLMDPVAAKFEVFVSNVETGNLSAIDPVTFEIKTLICTSRECDTPRNLAASHTDSSVYVPVDSYDTVFNIDADNPDLNNDIFDSSFYNPYGVAFTCSGSEAWVVNAERDGSGRRLSLTSEMVIFTQVGNHNACATQLQSRSQMVRLI
jgi:hypothetical protein